MKNVREISLRPYNGRLFYCSTKKSYLKAHQELFNESDAVTCETEGRFCGGEGKDGIWTYIVWAESPHVLAHELSHVIFHVFDRCGLNPSDSGGEAFCYMLSQLIIDATA